MSTCSHNKVTQEKNLHIKETLHNYTLLDAQMQEGGAAEATGGLSTTGQPVNSPK